METTFSVYWIIPFILILLSIALLPLFFPHFWEKNRNKAIIAIGLAIPVAIMLAIQDYHYLLEALHEYVSFIALIGSLYVVSGGICFDVEIKPKPLTNTAILALGTGIASIIGTTGASILLIRPLLKANRKRKNIKHIPIFFIFTVSNIGGLLTPIGDPPLFLGFLRGVDFFWTLRLFPIWLFCNAILLTIFYIWDRWAYQKEDITPSATSAQSPKRILGAFNFIFLIGVVGSVFLPEPYRQISMVGLAVVSYFLTSSKIRRKNSFTFHPVNEVAVLFIGIFIAMIPALTLLQANGTVLADKIGLDQPGEFFWITGILSSFLDNAPTYLTFFSLSQGMAMPGATEMVGIPDPILAAISAGAVLMGANTYIGNGPNFMVKAIAEESGVKTPSFFGFFGYALVILFPLYLAVTFLFL